MDKANCSKAALVSRQGLRVQYCLSHRMVEIDIGAISLRLDAASFYHLSEGLADAQLILEGVGHDQQAFARLMQRIKNG